MKFNSQICTSREQSERLLSLGVRKETADCALFLNGNNEFEQLSKFGNWEKYADMLPAWSLHRLIEMALRYVLICGISFTFNEDAYEKVIGIIEHQIKEGYFNKEYLV